MGAGCRPEDRSPVGSACLKPLGKCAKPGSMPVISHVAQISFFTDPLGRAPERLLLEWPSLVDVAEAASRTGLRVSVIQACAVTERLTRNGVDYHFLPFGPAVRRKQPMRGFGELLRRLSPNVCHVHGLGFPHD